MKGSLHDVKVAERVMLSGLSLVCFSATLASLVALGYLVSVLALGVAERHGAAVNFMFGSA